MNHELKRISTGVPQLDQILFGGFPANSLNVVIGKPGSGKTILVEKLLFHNAAGPRPVLYFTTLSEPLGKVVQYLQQFEFFDESKLGSSVLYEDLGGMLSEKGIAGLVPRLSEVIKTLKPAIIVIDSFKAIYDLAPSTPEWRRALHELAGLITAYRTTVFLVGEYGPEQVAEYPEFAVADSILQLEREERSTRDDRSLRVVKLRGSNYLQGAHTFRISSAGLVVSPRLISPRLPPGYKADFSRIPSGVEGLDAILGGGLLASSTTLLGGPTGSGKTTMALQFALEAVRKGEPALYVNFQENPTQLAAQASRYGFDPSKGGRGKLHTYYRSPVELQIDSIVVEIFDLVREHGIRRVVIDSLADLAMAAPDATRLHSYLYALLQQFATHGAAAMLTVETERGLVSAVETGGLSYMSDTIILLGIDLGERVRRTVAVVKARNSAHDLAVHELVIGEKGARVGK